MIKENDIKMNVRKRIDEDRISRLLSYDELIAGSPSKERIMGRLEAYLQTGVVIDQYDLIKVIQEYNFSPKEYRHLVPLAHVGLIEGLIQEPDNMPHYAERLGCFSSLANKFFEEEKNV